MNFTELTKLIDKVGQLSIKMRFLKAAQGAESGTSELKDREILILELLGSNGPMTVTDIRKHFPSVAPSTISADLKKLRVDLRYIEKKFGADGRTHIVELTPEGIEKVQNIKRERMELYKPLRDASQKKPEAVTVLLDFMELAIDNVNQMLKKCGWPE